MACRGDPRDDERVRISEATLPAHGEEIVAFVAEREPLIDSGLVRSSIDRTTALSLRCLTAREETGGLGGVGVAASNPGMPEGWRFVIVLTRQDLAGRGHASRLYAELLVGLEDDVTTLSTGVVAEDEASMAVARGWGYQVRQLSVTSTCDLSAARPPAPSAGVKFDACDDLTFEDEEAVEAMLLASQTNPEFDLGAVCTLASLRNSPAGTQSPVAVIARVEGRPAAISFAVGDGESMHVFYTGVDPDLRGRALGRATKQFLHAHARDLGIRTAFTDNEEHNAGIRHVNDQLGYVRHHGSYWMTRPRERG
jgi:GNAT superfamily N-acetyltransferase